VNHRMISADDHIDLGYLPRDLWTARLPESLRDRAPHVEDRGDKGEFWVCDGETWSDYRGERWFARSNRTRLALDRGGVGEAHRPTTPEKRLADMDRDGVEASLMFPPIIAMQVGDAELSGDSGRHVGRAVECAAGGHDRKARRADSSGASVHETLSPV